MRHLASSVLRLLVRFPAVSATVVVGIAALVLTAVGLALAARGAVTVFVIGVAALQLWRMVRQFRRGHWGLDVLAVLAIASTVAVGEYWAALVVALMITGGGALEDYANARARRQMDALLQRTPRVAHRIGDSGGTTEIDIDSVVVGDLLLVKPGEMVPVDAQLYDAASEFDESSITGESLPVERAVGAVVPSGAINGDRAVRLRAVSTAGDSQYQRIVALVADAASTKARFVRIADRVSIPFTAVALALAGLGWALSGDPVRAAEVLVAATPCPLLIAAPVAFVAGMGSAARNGVIIKSGDSLEALARPKTIAFDKTGTLTRGAPRVERIETAPGVQTSEVLAIAAGAEAMSPHVLARAVVDAAHAAGIEGSALTNVREIAGSGMLAELAGRAIRVGKPDFAAEDRGDPFPILPLGDTAIAVAVEDRVIGRLVLRDEVRPEARKLIARLRGRGVLRILMLTGDAGQTARTVAEEVGIDEVHADLLPADKVNIVAAAHERPVVMVGDGVNDAPVLAAADVGVAMGARGATAASESAQVVILLDDLERLDAAISIARRTVRIATQSIWLGIGLSVALMLVATTGVIPAIVGAVAQELIDVATIVNGLRATRTPPGRDPGLGLSAGPSALAATRRGS
ncbi:MAG: heavy metal translocating P-type ATPase [Pseudolysinimonas sp.]